MNETPGNEGTNERENCVNRASENNCDGNQRQESSCAAAATAVATQRLVYLSVIYSMLLLLLLLYRCSMFSFAVIIFVPPYMVNEVKNHADSNQTNQDITWASI